MAPKAKRAKDWWKDASERCSITHKRLSFQARFLQGKLYLAAQKDARRLVIEHPKKRWSTESGIEEQKAQVALGILSWANNNTWVGSRLREINQRWVWYRGGKEGLHINLDQGTATPLSLRRHQAEAVENTPKEWPSHRRRSLASLRFGRGSSQLLIEVATAEDRGKAVKVVATVASLDIPDE